MAYKINGKSFPDTHEYTGFPTIVNTELARFQHLWTTILKPEIYKHEHVTLSKNLVEDLKYTCKINDDVELFVHFNDEKRFYQYNGEDDDLL